MGDYPVCIDISHWQDYPDFKEVRDAGVLGMIHKATEGTSYIDPNRAENCANAAYAGIAIATYHWLSPGSNAKAQMEFYLSVIDPVPGERVVIDYEEEGCTLAMLKEAVQSLMDYGGLKITVYSGHLLKEQLGSKKDDFLAANTDLWLAQYTSGTPTWPSATYPQWALWQYSETGVIPGIDDAFVDLNNFNGSNDEFLMWISPETVIPPKPQPKPKPEGTVQVAVTAPQNIEVAVTVNGQRIGRRHPSFRKAKKQDLFHRRK